MCREDLACDVAVGSRCLKTLFAYIHHYRTGCVAPEENDIHGDFCGASDTTNGWVQFLDADNEVMR
ncbi:hypothetical protein D3C85_1099530 [compost metagenome]